MRETRVAILESEEWIFRVCETDVKLVRKHSRTVSGQSPVGKVTSYWQQSRSSVLQTEKDTTESEHKLDQVDCKNSSRITLQNNNDTKLTHAVKHRRNRWMLLLLGTHNVSYLVELNEESPVLDSIQSPKGKAHSNTETNRGLVQTITLILDATDSQGPTGTMRLHC